MLVGGHPMSKPKIKEIHGIFYLPGRIRIGTGLDYAIEIDDPEGKYTLLIKLLNGDNTVSEIVTLLSGTLSEQEVLEGIQLLIDEGYVEDAAIPAPSEFTEQELLRYRVNINFFNTLCKGDQSKYEYQLKLKNAHIVLFGLGGIGSNIALALAELGVGRITAIDFDRVELHNLNRQVLYSTSAVGELKTDIAKKRIGDFNTDIQFETINHRIDSLDDVRHLLDQYPCDVVVDAADRPTGFIDFWVNEACVERGIPYFAATVSKKYGRLYSVIPGETACYNCRVLTEFDTSTSIREELEFVQESNFWAPNGALGPACMFHSYFISYEILRYLLELGPLITFNKTLEINFLTFEQEYTHFEKHEKCEVCAKAATKAEVKLS
jgi:molybdopterin-synthase adenylyltransferase